MIESLNSTGFLSDRSTIGSDFSYLFSLATTMLFLASGYMARKKAGLAHHYMVLASMFVMVAYFIFYYQVRKLGLASFADQLGFEGPQWVYNKIFRPALIIHFIAVTASVYLAIYMIINGYSTAIRHSGGMILRDGQVKSSPLLWGVGLLWLALLIYFVFYTHNFGLFHKVMFFFLGYGLPVGIALIINLTLCRADQRHRVIGRLCLLFFLLLLITSTLVYYLLYIVHW